MISNVVSYTYKSVPGQASLRQFCQGFLHIRLSLTDNCCYWISERGRGTFTEFNVFMTKFSRNNGPDENFKGLDRELSIFRNFG